MSESSNRKRSLERHWLEFIEYAKKDKIVSDLLKAHKASFDERGYLKVPIPRNPNDDKYRQSMVELFRKLTDQLDSLGRFYRESPIVRTPARAGAKKHDLPIGGLTWTLNLTSGVALQRLGHGSYTSGQKPSCDTKKSATIPDQQDRHGQHSPVSDLSPAAALPTTITDQRSTQQEQASVKGVYETTQAVKSPLTHGVGQKHECEGHDRSPGQHKKIRTRVETPPQRVSPVPIEGQSQSSQDYNVERDQSNEEEIDGTLEAYDIWKDFCRVRENHSLRALFEKANEVWAEKSVQPE